MGHCCPTWPFLPEVLWALLPETVPFCPSLTGSNFLSSTSPRRCCLVGLLRPLSEASSLSIPAGSIEPMPLRLLLVLHALCEGALQSSEARLLAQGRCCWGGGRSPRCRPGLPRTAGPGRSRSPAFRPGSIPAVRPDTSSCRHSSSECASVCLQICRLLP